MSENEKQELENLEIEPLSDGDLESVAGGVAELEECSGCHKKSYCTSGPGEIEEL